jgi:hypothetical protein
MAFWRTAYLILYWGTTLIIWFNFDGSYTGRIALASSLRCRWQINAADCAPTLPIVVSWFRLCVSNGHSKKQP